ncbi:hypothetical protein D8674_024678 [Pyrus ussuriensis x Pyrus communis]|uniref:Uncharacterized protein n=1 Tax=Pyrus ussuriensis x Pyrus communis TaxID=2448454 RepID=A0A5N5H3K9_9ROSA|nr:hypothetical protein D8674_024678 [Pyrus ussuriensis x Pyrus communis]
MLHLIRSRKEVTTAPSSIPLPPTIAATALVKMDPRPANSLDPVDPRVSYMPASSDSSMALPASARRGHRRPRTPDTTSASTTDASRSQPTKKNTWGPCSQLKTTKVTRMTNKRITIKYNNRHRAAPTAEQHSALAHDIGHVALEEGCPKEFKDREDNWAWLCSHFQEPDYVKKAKANKGNREKKTLLHHSNSRPFSYKDGGTTAGNNKFRETNISRPMFVSWYFVRGKHSFLKFFCNAG